MANDYWKDFKNLFKSKQRIKEEESQAIGEAVKKEQDILKRLKELEEEYQASIKEETPDFDGMFAPVTLDRVKYEVDDDEKIRQAAESVAEAKIAPKITSINAKALDDLSAAEKQKELAAENKSRTLGEINALYEALREKAVQDGVKKGIARGSIVENQINDYGKLKSGSELSAERDYADTVKGLDEKIAALESERQVALNDLNLQKAVAISENIGNLTAKRDKTLADETAKNNAVEKQETELNAKLQKEKEKYINDYYADKTKQAEKQAAYEKVNGYSGDKQYNYAERYNLALQFYLSLDPDIAPKALEASGNMKYYLGNYYDKLMSVLSERDSEGRKYI